MFCDPLCVVCAAVLPLRQAWMLGNAACCDHLGTATTHNPTSLVVGGAVGHTEGVNLYDGVRGALGPREPDCRRGKHAKQG